MTAQRTALPRAALVLVALWLLVLPGTGSTRDGGSPGPSAGRLVGYEPLPEGVLTCEQQTAPMIRELRRQEWPAAATGAGSSIAPVRMIRDPYAAFAAIAVDPARNEVVVTDENLFSILVYDRLAKTPPEAKMTTPKRAIAGVTTKIEFQSGVYVDPASGDIYAANNDTVDKLVVFSRSANGNVAPARELETPHGTFGIAVDEGRGEIFLSVQHDHAIVVYPKTVRRADPPVRLLQGRRTRLADPHGITIDAKNDLLYVTNHGSVSAHGEASRPTGTDGADTANWPSGRGRLIAGSGEIRPPSITVYARTAHGDAAPQRTIEGPKTGLNWPTGVAVDAEHDELFVANDGADAVLVFRASARGDVAPLRVIRGERSLIKNPTGVFYDRQNDELWVANFGSHAATAYPRTAAGDAAPVRVIRSAPTGAPSLGIGNPHPLAYDRKREQILVPN